MPFSVERAVLKPRVGCVRRFRQQARAIKKDVPIVPYSVACGNMPVAMPRNAPQRRRKVGRTDT